MRQHTEPHTICARATPPGNGAIAIVRVSGPQAIPLVDRLFLAHREGQNVLRAKSHSLIFGHIISPHTRQHIDDVLVAVMRGPHSYTGEDVVEINCHGSPAVVRTLLRVLTDHGARLAEPGEFTRRAFENGQIDLAQAEAVCDLIAAQTQSAAETALRRLGGQLSERLATVRGALIDLLAEIEAHIDFPEEDLPTVQIERWGMTLDGARDEIAQMEAGGARGHLLAEGARVAIIGKPNAGKSALFNRLVGQERAIVTATPGTTRDSLESLAEAAGLPLLFVDTAGVREAADEIERIGIERTQDQIHQANQIIVCIPADEPISREDERVWSMAKGLDPLVVLTKCDLKAALTPPEVGERLGVKAILETSSVTGKGLEKLVQTIGRRLLAGVGSETNVDPLVAGERHLECLRSARDSLAGAAESLDSAAPRLEVIASDLRAGLAPLDEILGLEIGDAVLDRIFARFCIGK
jgi:tRNA modification GTPase